MPIVTFTSDFGTSDHYVAAVKATLLTLRPDLQVVDVSHEVQPFDIAHMAYVLRSVYQKFPEGTVHLIATNGNQATGDVLLTCEIKSHFFVAPDNGILSLLEENFRANVFRAVDEGTTNFQTLKAAELATQLAGGKKPEELGTYAERYVQLMLRQPKATKKEIAGHIIRVDHYGNLITNIKKLDFDILSRDRRYTLHFGREQTQRVHQSIQEVEPGEAFFIFNQEGLLEIGINQGHASQLLGLNFDSPVQIQFEE